MVTGKDDGIDHNGANLLIRGCRIEGFDNEGIAASNSNNISVYNTLVKNCEQGIEAGYGNPTVSVDHCTLINNEIGLRFGDSYNWGCEGQIYTTNSVLFGNGDNILNYDLLLQAAVPGAIEISYSMTNDSDYNESPNCISGIPVFDENYYLLAGSPGEGAANDGYDMGIISPELSLNEIQFLYNSMKLFPNPFSEFVDIEIYLPNKSDIILMVYDSFGKRVSNYRYPGCNNGKHTLSYVNDHKLKGMVYFRILVGKKMFTQKAMAF
jgi:hypothetical protein